MPDPLPPELRRTWDLFVARGVKGAAHELGCHPQTVKHRLSVIRSRLGVDTNIQAAIALSTGDTKVA